MYTGPLMLVAGEMYEVCWRREIVALRYTWLMVGPLQSNRHKRRAKGCAGRDRVILDEPERQNRNCEQNLQ